MIVLSIFAAAAFIRSSDGSELYWVAKQRIAVGDRITTDDLALTRLELRGLTDLYFRSHEDLVGMIASESVMVGEAIARSEVTDRSDNILWRLVSLDLARNDIPVSVGEGSLVDLYSISDRSSQGSSAGGVAGGMAELVLASLVVDQVIEGGSLSDRAQVILRIRLPEVRPLLDAYSRGPLLLVDHVS